MVPTGHRAVLLAQRQREPTNRIFSSSFVRRVDCASGGSIVADLWWVRAHVPIRRDPTASSAAGMELLAPAKTMTLVTELEGEGLQACTQALDVSSSNGMSVLTINVPALLLRHNESQSALYATLPRPRLAQGEIHLSLVPVWPRLMSHDAVLGTLL